MLVMTGRGDVVPRAVSGAVRWAAFCSLRCTRLFVRSFCSFVRCLLGKHECTELFPVALLLYYILYYFFSLRVLPFFSFPSLPFPSLPFPSLPFPSLPFLFLPFPSLPFLPYLPPLSSSAPITLPLSSCLQLEAGGRLEGKCVTGTRTRFTFSPTFSRYNAI